MSATFCLSLIFNPTTVGMGNASRHTSVNTPIAAVATYIAGRSRHTAVSASKGSQLAAKGLQANKRLKQTAAEEPTQTKQSIQTPI